MIQHWCAGSIQHWCMMVQVARAGCRCEQVTRAQASCASRLHKQVAQVWASCTSRLHKQVVQAGCMSRLHKQVAQACYMRKLHKHVAWARSSTGARAIRHWCRMVQVVQAGCWMQWCWIGGCWIVLRRCRMGCQKCTSMSSAGWKKNYFCSPLPLSAKRLNKFISAK